MNSPHIPVVADSVSVVPADLVGLVDPVGSADRIVVPADSEDRMENPDSRTVDQMVSDHKTNAPVSLEDLEESQDFRNAVPEVLVHKAEDPENSEVPEENQDSQAVGQVDLDHKTNAPVDSEDRIVERERSAHRNADPPAITTFPSEYYLDSICPSEQDPQPARLPE